MGGGDDLHRRVETRKSLAVEIGEQLGGMSRWVCGRWGGRLRGRCGRCGVGNAFAVVAGCVEDVVDLEAARLLVKTAHELNWALASF